MIKINEKRIVCHALVKKDDYDFQRQTNAKK